jgi:HTH-type transcriptional regulator, transcriptional repressor of NAD biosynthesis genes
MAPTDVLRVCIVGAESTGKTTLAAALATRLDTVCNPEYGRVYTEVGRERGAPWATSEFTHIARIHCWYEDFLAGLANRVLVCDTDAFTTALFHEAYLGTPAAGFESEASRRYDLYVVCGTDVSFTHDGWREFEAQRMWMHERLLEHARESGSPWLLVEGPHEVRLAAVMTAVERLLAAL